VRWPRGWRLFLSAVEAAPMSKEMEYFLSASHWFDALTPPREQHFAQLAEMIQRLLFKNTKQKVALGTGQNLAAVSPTTKLPGLGALRL